MQRISRHLSAKPCTGTVCTLLLGFALSSCEVLSPETRIDEAADAPGAWTATKAGKAGIDNKWVDRIGGISLRKLVAEAFDANGDLRAAGARVERVAALSRGREHREDPSSMQGSMDREPRTTSSDSPTSGLRAREVEADQSRSSTTSTARP